PTLFRSLRAGCHRHGVEMRADNDVGFVRLEALRFRDHIERRAAGDWRAPGDPGWYPDSGPPHVVTEALESALDERGGVGEVVRGGLARSDVVGQMDDVAERSACVHDGS